MIGDGKGNFKPLSLSTCGFIVDGDAKGMGRIETKRNGSLILATQNGDSLKIFKDNTTDKLKRVYPEKNEMYALLHFTNGGKRKMELSFGSTYLSQSSRSIIVTKDVKEIELFNNNGKLNRTINF